MAAELTDLKEPASGRTALSQFRCADCGYGASRRIAPDRCPMCSGTVWDYQPWRPFAGLLAAQDADEPLSAET